MPAPNPAVMRSHILPDSAPLKRPETPFGLTEAEEAEAEADVGAAGEDVGVIGVFAAALTLASRELTR